MKLTWKHAAAAFAVLIAIAWIRQRVDPPREAAPAATATATPIPTVPAAPEPSPRRPPPPADPLVWRTVGGHVGAVSRAKLDRAVRLVADGDRVAFDRLLATDPGVFVLAPGIEVYVADEGGITGSVVRVRKKGDTAEIWTVREAIER